MLTSEIPLNQAAGLTRLGVSKPVKVIAVSGGKGGIGKTNISVNLALALAKNGNATILLDADFGLANVDVMLGLHPAYDLSHVISGEKTLDEIMLSGPDKLRIVPAASGIDHMANLSAAERAGIIQAFSEIATDVDVMVVDTAAGVSNEVTSFCRAAQDIIVVVCDEPASITDAYAFIKIMSKDYGVERFHVLANMVRTAAEGRQVYNKLLRATDRFLSVALDYMGTVPFDEYVRKAVQQQKAVVEVYPRSPAALALKNLADKVDNWPEARTASGQLEFFMERLIEAELDHARYGS